MATIVKGHTISGAATAGGMHDMVELATISDIDRSSMDTATVSIATRSTTAPSGPTSREVWQTSPSNALATYDATNLKWVGATPNVVEYLLSASGSTVAAGDCLSPAGTVNEGGLTLLAADKSPVSAASVYAVALAAASPGSRSVAVVWGPVKVACSGTVNAGSAVVPSTSTAGAVQSAGAGGTGAGRTVIGVAISNNSGGFVWIHLRR